MSNDLNKIYETFGSNICLFPYMAAFYSQQLPEGVRPCSVINFNLEQQAVLDDDLIKSVNQKSWIDLRKNFMTGSCHTAPECKTCSIAEQNNGDSPRTLNNKYFAEHVNTDIISYVQTVIDNNYTVDRILSIDFAPSNYCNFECVMCTGSVSSTRNTFEIKIHGKENRIPLTFSNSTKFYTILDNAEIINFCGGETLLQTSVHTLIDYLIEQDLAKNLTISLLTNASKYPEKLREKFKQFKNVFYTISIDGVGPVIEYQRRGCKWNETEQVALQLWSEMGCVVNYVITAINVFSFVETVDWFAKHNIDRVILSLVFDANKNISIRVIPNDLRTNLLKKLTANLKKYQRNCHNELIEQMISIIESTAYEPELLPQFKSAIAIEDRVSKRKLVDVVPDWQPYLNDQSS